MDEKEDASIIWIEEHYIVDGVVRSHPSRDNETINFTSLFETVTNFILDYKPYPKLTFAFCSGTVY